MSLKPLSDKQEAFCREYLIDMNAAQAAIRAGYSSKAANVKGAQLLAKVSIRQRVDELMKERSERSQVTSDYVLNTIVDTIERCRQARPVLDPSGQPVRVESGTGEMAALFAFKPGEVLKGAELLGKHLKLFSEKIEHVGRLTLEDIVGASMVDSED